MGIGLGIVLVVIGLILVLGVVNFDISFVDDSALGWILLLVGVLAIILALVINQQRSRTTHVEERRYDDRGPR
jgi:protein-S-isoprenylcysteine O-methyltransferase Ste14